MAKKDAKMTIRHPDQPTDNIPPKRKLEYLLNETYVKIDELKVLLRQEADITGVSNVTDTAVCRMFARQDQLITLCAEACSEHERRNVNQAGASGLQGGSGIRPSCSYASRSSTTDKSQSGRTEKDYPKSDGSWYGSLDRSLAKKKKNQLLDKRRRHTKTIGSMAGLDVIKKSVELKPDEQYEIGLPTAPRVTSTRSSILPMTQHQYYNALMESKLTKKVAYPLDVRQSHFQYPPVGGPPPSRHTSAWGYLESLDENKNMKKRAEVQHPPVQPPILKPPKFVAIPCRSLGNVGSELALRQSSKYSKNWYESNLDEAPSSPLITQNPSPSPSMLSSTKGSSRGSVASGMDTVDSGIARMAISSPANESTEFTSKSSESSESWSGAGNEVTKPFEMSDYYKYSTKFRSRNSPASEEIHHYENRISSGPPSVSTQISHSRYPSQIRQGSIDAWNDYRDPNGNPVVGPKLPPTRQGSIDAWNDYRDPNGNPAVGPKLPPNRQGSIDAWNDYRDPNGNSAVGPKLPPKQRRTQSQNISSSSIMEDTTNSNGDTTNGDTTNANGDTSEEIWITNKPTFV